MLRKTTKLNIFKTILLIAVLVFGIFVVHYVWTTTPKSKLEIAALLEIDDVNIKTIDKDMICSVNTDGAIRITYKGQTIYETYIYDDGVVNVCYGTEVIAVDVPTKGLVCGKSRTENDIDLEIKKYVGHIHDLLERIVSIFTTAIFVIFTDIGIFLGFKELEKRNKE